MAILTPNQMEEGNEKLDGSEKTEREEIYSRKIRAGKRTYFIDVKATRRSDFYITITESKKRFYRDGKYFFEKHKIFLYKEDFEKFVDGLTEMVDFVRQHQQDFVEDYNRSEQGPEFESNNQESFNSDFEEEVEVEVDSYSNIDFDDLGEKR